MLLYDHDSNQLSNDFSRRHCLGYDSFKQSFYYKSLYTVVMFIQLLSLMFPDFYRENVKNYIRQTIFT